MLVRLYGPTVLLVCSCAVTLFNRHHNIPAAAPVLLVLHLTELQFQYYFSKLFSHVVLKSFDVSASTAWGVYHDVSRVCRVCVCVCVCVVCVCDCVSCCLFFQVSRNLFLNVLCVLKLFIVFDQYFTKLACSVFWHLFVILYLLYLHHAYYYYVGS